MVVIRTPVRRTARHVARERPAARATATTVSVTGSPNASSRVTHALPAAIAVSGCRASSPPARAPGPVNRDRAVDSLVRAVALGPVVARVSSVSTTKDTIARTAIRAPVPWSSAEGRVMSVAPSTRGGATLPHSLRITHEDGLRRGRVHVGPRLSCRLPGDGGPPPAVASDPSLISAAGGKQEGPRPRGPGTSSTAAIVSLALLVRPRSWPWHFVYAE